MIFKNTQASMPIYLFDRNNLTIITGKVTSVVPSHIDMKFPGKMIVDITCTVNGNTQTYSIDDSLTVAYFGSSTISLDIDAVLREIETLKSNSEQALKEVERHKEVVTKCNQLLVENNPKLKEKQEVEKRFADMEGKMDRMMEMMREFMK